MGNETNLACFEMNYKVSYPHNYNTIPPLSSNIWIQKIITFVCSASNILSVLAQVTFPKYNYKMRWIYIYAYIYTHTHACLHMWLVKDSDVMLDVWGLLKICSPRENSCFGM